MNEEEDLYMWLWSPAESTKGQVDYDKAERHLLSSTTHKVIFEDTTWETTSEVSHGRDGTFDVTDKDPSLNSTGLAVVNALQCAHTNAVRFYA